MSIKRVLKSISRNRQLSPLWWKVLRRKQPCADSNTHVHLWGMSALHLWKADLPWGWKHLPCQLKRSALALN